MDHVPASDPERSPLPMVTEPVWLEPYPDALLDEIADPAARYVARETIELAFMAAIQLLPPKQRAVLILRDVLGWSAREVATLLGSTAASVNSALQRARAGLATRRARSGWEPPGSPSSEERALLDRYMRAFQEADVPALIELLRGDAVMSMPPDPTWFRGREAIGAFFTRWVFPVGGSLGNAFGGASHELQGPRLVPTGANRQPAFAIYQRAEDGSFRALALQVLTTRAGLVSDITGFVAPELFPYFDLPGTHRS
jgi:RNA polymerase sigma-70 factor (ECF subfamily)